MKPTQTPTTNLTRALPLLAALLFITFFSLLSCDDVESDDKKAVPYGHDTLKVNYHAIILPELVGSAEYSFVISKETTAPAYSATSDAFVSRKLTGTPINLLLAWNDNFAVANVTTTYLTEAKGALEAATAYHLYVYKAGTLLSDKTEDFTTLTLPTAAAVTAAIPPTDDDRNALYYSQQFYGSSIELSVKEDTAFLLPIVQANPVTGLNIFGDNKSNGVVYCDTAKYCADLTRSITGLIRVIEPLGDVQFFLPPTTPIPTSLTLIDGTYRAPTDKDIEITLKATD